MKFVDEFKNGISYIILSNFSDFLNINKFYIYFYIYSIYIIIFYNGSPYNLAGIYNSCYNLKINDFIIKFVYNIIYKIYLT